MRHNRKIVRIAVRRVCQYHSLVIMQWFNMHAAKNARSYIGITSRTYTPVRLSNFSFQFVVFFSFDFDLIAVIVRSFCISMPHSPILDFSRRRYDVLSIFKMAANVAQFYVQYRMGWLHFLQKVCQHTKYRQDNLIHGRDITISILQKQTSAILKFFFRFRHWPHHRNLHWLIGLNFQPPKRIGVTEEPSRNILVCTWSKSMDPWTDRQTLVLHAPKQYP